jgi:vacuolar-type H+-ATPase subunit H
VGLNGAENCVEAVRAMRRELDGAKKSLINSDNCVVSRSNLTAQMDYLEQNLPDTVRRAAEIVRAEETIRRETEEKKNQILSDAKSEAERIEADANAQAREFAEQVKQEANAVLEKANQEASACVEAARAEASRMLEDAEKKARQMVEEETWLTGAEAAEIFDIKLLEPLKAVACVGKGHFKNAPENILVEPPPADETEDDVDDEAKAEIEVALALAKGALL